MKRGMDLTMSTIIIIIVLVITAVAILTFFTRGATSSGGTLTGSVPDADEGSMGDINPLHWACADRWACMGAKGNIQSSDYDSWKLCDADCGISSNPNKKCICQQPTCPTSVYTCGNDGFCAEKNDLCLALHAERNPTGGDVQDYSNAAWKYCKSKEASEGCDCRCHYG